MTTRINLNGTPRSTSVTKPLQPQTGGTRATSEPAPGSPQGVQQDRDQTTNRRPNTARLSLEPTRREPATLDGGEDSAHVLMRGCVPAAFASMWRKARPEEAARVAQQLAAGETVRVNDLPLSVSARDRAAIEKMDLSPRERVDVYLQFGIMGAGRYLEGSPAERNAMNAQRGTGLDLDVGLTRAGLGQRGVAGLASRLDLPVKFVDSDFTPGDFVAWGPRGNKHAVQVAEQRGDSFTLVDAYGNEWIRSQAELRAGASLSAGDDIGGLTSPYASRGYGPLRFR